MNLQAMSQLGEFVGGFGVIFTLVYLAIQVRSNTNSQRADMTARILERLAAQQHSFGFDVEANEFFMRCSGDPTKLSMEERARFQWVMTEFLSSMEFLMQQYEAGNVDEQVWLRWQKTMDFWLSFPGIKAYWTARATPYTDSFTTLIEQRLTSNDYSFNVENYRTYMLTGQTPDR
ncbi:MAG: hypothetical protein ACI9XU_001913 [Arenicella sp.]|jgi:hypothetical protein